MDEQRATLELSDLIDEKPEAIEALEWFCQREASRWARRLFESCRASRINPEEAARFAAHSFSWENFVKEIKSFCGK